MTRELIGGFPVAHEREQMGRFLRHAFPLGLGLFKELLGSLEEDERVKPRSDDYAQ